MHAWSDEAPLEETLSALEHAVSSGRARYVGISNYSGWQTARAATLLQQAGGAAGRRPRWSTRCCSGASSGRSLPAAQALGLGLLAWSPLGRGVLTGKYRGGTPADSRGASPHCPSSSGSTWTPRPAGRGRRRHRRRRPRLLARRGGARLGARPAGGGSVLVGARTAAQLRASLASEDVELPAQITAVLDEVSAPVVAYPERF